MTRAKPKVRVFQLDSAGRRHRVKNPVAEAMRALLVTHLGIVAARITYRDDKGKLRQRTVRFDK